MFSTCPSFLDCDLCPCDVLRLVSSIHHKFHNTATTCPGWQFTKCTIGSRSRGLELQLPCRLSSTSIPLSSEPGLHRWQARPEAIATRRVNCRSRREALSRSPRSEGSLLEEQQHNGVPPSALRSHAPECFDNAKAKFVSVKKRTERRGNRSRTKTIQECHSLLFRHNASWFWTVNIRSCRTARAHRGHRHPIPTVWLGN